MIVRFVKFFWMKDYEIYREGINDARVTERVWYESMGFVLWYKLWANTYDVITILMKMLDLNFTTSKRVGPVCVFVEQKLIKLILRMLR